MKKSSKLILVVVIILIIAIICVGAWLLIDNQRKSNEKISELKNQISSINKNSTNTSENQNSDVLTNTVNETSITSNTTSSDKKDNQSADNYNKYIVTWVDENDSSELNVLTIGNNQLAFSWAIYRIGGIDNAVVPMENNKALFYYQGYDDKNYNSKHDEGEHYYRRATIQLNTESINVNVENIKSSEYDITKERDVIGSSYIDKGTYIYKIK